MKIKHKSTRKGFIYGGQSQQAGVAHHKDTTMSRQAVPSGEGWNSLPEYQG